MHPAAVIFSGGCPPSSRQPQSQLLPLPLALPLLRALRAALPRCLQAPGGDITKTWRLKNVAANWMSSRSEHRGRARLGSPLPVMPHACWLLPRAARRSLAALGGDQAAMGTPPAEVLLYKLFAGH